jgi:catechol 2,3-dioxygenase-like lactoylglutathione lyase family enzyme
MSDWTTTGDPRLTRFRFATIGASDLAAIESQYGEWLGYRVRERGAVSADLAESWGTPAMAGRPYVVMSTEGAADDYIRAVEITQVPGYRPLTTFGWAAFEIIVDDVYAVDARLRESAFEILAGPTPLQFMPSIVAMQAVGPAGECLYFTMESGDRETSILPRPRSFVDRPFIFVIAGSDFDALRLWYCDRFDLKRRPLRESRIRIVQQAQGLDADTIIHMTTAGLREQGYLIEFDAYPTGPGRVAGPRPHAPGELPPGCAMASFGVTDIGLVSDAAIAPPAARQGIGYDGRRSCAVVGPAGERVEFIED